MKGKVAENLVLEEWCRIMESLTEKYERKVLDKVDLGKG